MYSKFLIRLQILIAGAALLMGTAHAAITVTDSTSIAANSDYSRLANGADLSHTSTSWSLNGGNAIVVLFSGENASTFSASFGGEALTIVQAFDGTNFVAGVGYLINPSNTTSDLVVNATNSGTSRLSGVHSILSLSGVGAFDDSATRTGNGNLAYATSSDNGFVVGAGVNNSYNFSTQISVSGNADTNLFHAAVDGNQSSRHLYGDVLSAGSYSDNYSGGIKVAATAAFTEAIPEPSTAALTCMAMLCMLLRRNRH